MIGSPEQPRPDQIELVKKWAEGDGPGREHYCCFETVIERIAESANFQLNEDSYVLAGGKLREKWPQGSAAWCRGPAQDFQRDNGRAADLVHEITHWVTSRDHPGIGQRWADHVLARVSPQCSSIVQTLLNKSSVLRWGPQDLRDKASIQNQNNVLYALWRPDAEFNPVGRIPLYIGTATNLWKRWYSGPTAHVRWWGGGSVVFTVVQSASAVAAEREIIGALCPFTNVSANKLHSVWKPFFAAESALSK